MKIKNLVLGPVSTNCYFLINEQTKETIIIDPADSPQRICEKISGEQLMPVAILLTHGHFDHIMAVEEVGRTYSIPHYIYETEAELMESPELNASLMINGDITVKRDRVLKDKEVLTLAGFTIEVIHTPGHTAGSVCYYIQEEKALFSGDTLFYNSVGRTDLPTGNGAALIKSVKERLFNLPEDTGVYPGHGMMSSIGYEKNNNPYFRR
ncbi:MBL fold metallo-hydrolase [Anaerocolumna xylanovorans]|uniref:Glyoxylase, beta-lactamase superfamily II n=1 Tax=Anaerocolumna xylanovorans DSM 12503 TaxID=1121345 RepID=A0A1M7YDI6_9FIRM|nr:MBL fold metallo-hydrolase [Anaerocolumna xylanovorans]SHO50700.1 Glyoxylase, beta-lactamase superfamily II [Anaerocolumna xylanovorans DSM 12503]